MNKPISAGVRSRLAVTYRAISDLFPDPRNARTHPKRQIDQLQASVAAFGFTNPILADPKAISSPAMAGFRPRGRWASLKYRSSPCPASRRRRSGPCGLPTTRSRSMRAGIWKSCNKNWVSSLGNGLAKIVPEGTMADLTPRERHVLAALELGLPNKLIAVRLNLSETP